MFSDGHKDMAMMVAERVFALAGDPLPFFQANPKATLSEYADAAWMASGDGVSLTAQEQHLALYYVEQLAIDDLNALERHAVGGAR